MSLSEGLEILSWLVIAIGLWLLTSNFRNARVSLQRFCDDAVKRAKDLQKALGMDEPEKQKVTFGDNYLGLSQEGKLVLKKQPSDAVIETFEQDVELDMYIQRANNSTGVALVFTFLLLALSVFEIGQALQNSGSADSSKMLSAAFLAMAFKFIISVFGVGSTLFILGKIREQRQSTLEEVKLILVIEKDKILTEAEYLINFAKRSLHLQESLKRLDNLEVNITGFGEEIITRLEAGMTNALGTKLADILSTTIGESLTKISAEISGSMKEIAVKLDSKSQNGVEDIVKKIDSMLSGGTKQHTENLGLTMNKFDKAVGDLSTSIESLKVGLKEITDTSGNNVQKQQDFVSNDLPKTFEKLKEVMDSLDKNSREAAEANRKQLEEIEKLVSGAYKNNEKTFEDLKNNLDSGAEKWNEVLRKNENQIVESGKNASEQLQNSLNAAIGKLEEAAIKSADAIEKLSKNYESIMTTQNDELDEKLKKQVEALNSRVGTLLDGVNKAQNAQAPIINDLTAIAGSLKIAEEGIASSLAKVGDLNTNVQITSENIKKIPGIVDDTSIKVGQLLVNQNDKIDKMNVALTDSTKAWSDSANEFSKKYESAAETIREQFDKFAKGLDGQNTLGADIQELADEVRELTKEMKKK